MAHYALVDENNVVVSVITGRDENEVVDGITDWEEYYSEQTSLRALRTSYNTIENTHLSGGTPFRGYFAGLGFTYDEDLDIFIPLPPFDSWVFNRVSMIWEAPIPYPAEGDWVWDEDVADWVEASGV